MRTLGVLLRAALGSAVGIVGSCTEPRAVPAGLEGEQPAFQASVWDDGSSEVASYRIVERRYGSLRRGHATLILVKERFDADELVKAEGPRPPARSFDVMKLNHVLTTPTGVYTYRQMASVFLHREHARPVKLVTSSQEWCGTTSKRLEIHGPDATLHTSSYFGAEGDRAFFVPLNERTVLFDSLPAWLRTLDLARTGSREVRLVPAQLSNHALPVEVSPATITVGSPAPLAVPAGAYDAVPVTVEHTGGTDVFHLRAEAPHTLVRWDRADGGRYELEWVRRARFWEMNAPEHVDALGPDSPASSRVDEPDITPP